MQAQAHRTRRGSDLEVVAIPIAILIAMVVLAILIGPSGPVA